MQRGVPFKPGNKAAAKRGPNKITRTVKETVLSVFLELQADPRHDLLAFAKKRPVDFYNIAAKLIPTELTGTVKTIITVKESE